MNRETPKQGETWKHFKGNMCTIICIAQHTETNEQMVIYKCNDSNFARPLSMFMSEVDHEKYPDAKQKYRLIKVL